MNKVRYAVATLSLSAAGFVGLVVDEHYTDRAVIPTRNDRPTVGFGSTFRDDGSPVRMGDTITPPAAVARSYAHIAKDEAGIKRCVTAPLHQAEYDSLVDFAYQYGVSTTCKSSMVKHINAGEYAQACEGYMAYKYLTTRTPTPGWEEYRFEANGRIVTGWRFDCTTPGNKVCRGVGTRQLGRKSKCLAAQ